ncbi:UNVERIFIED_CONTAM: hypothetical protein FKN15_018149 [Acipenser sinensis]
MSCSMEMSGFHRCTSCQAKLPASDPHDNPAVIYDDAAGASAALHEPSLPNYSWSEVPTRSARARSPSPSRVCPRRESRSPSRTPRRRGRSRSPCRDRRCRDRSGVVELTSKMSQFMEMMMGQQSLLMSMANAVPRAPEQFTGPIASQPVAPLQPPLAISLPVQPQDWDIDAISRDASDILGEDSIEAEVAAQHSDQVAESEVMDTDDPVWPVVDRATRHLGIDWPGTELPLQPSPISPGCFWHSRTLLRRCSLLGGLRLLLLRRLARLQTLLCRGLVRPA